MTQYERFWQQPIGTGTPIPFLALLYAITCLAASHFDDPNPVLPDPKRTIQSHREKTIQALVLGKYTHCPPFALEALLVFLQAEHLRSEDSEMSASILLGMVVKLAMRMGYHRDASHFPQISALEGEMQRRVWALIVQFDALASIQEGLPRMIRRPVYDTKRPGNLFDNDFHEEDEVLPVERPDTVQTPAQFLVVKNKMLEIYGTIAHSVTSITPLGGNEIMTLDMSLHNAYVSIPAGLRMRSLSEEFMEPEDVIIRRIYIALIFEEAKCVLHQKLLRFKREDKRYAHSRSVCVEAAMKILEYQHLLETETQAGGRIYQERWRISKLARSSFLLATSVLCSEIDQDVAETSLSREEESTGIERKQRMMEALEKSYHIWDQISHCTSSAEAAKAATTINIVLSKAKKLPAAETGMYSRRGNFEVLATL